MNRKTLGSYIQSLNDFGVEIATYNDNHQGYYLISRDFEESEVHVLCNLIHSSHFISDKVSSMLIDKLLHTQSKYHKTDFVNHVHIQNWRKTTNKDLFYNVDVLLEAIRQKKVVSFQYLKYDLQKNLVPRREQPYTIHPYYIVEENDNLYLLCKTSTHPNINHYRIDKIRNIRIMDEDSRKLEQSFDPYEYTKTKKYMYAGDPITVFLRCHKSILDDILDCFGRDISLQEDSKDCEYFIARVYSSRQGIIYYAMQYGLHCEILEPLDLREEVIKCLYAGLDIYKSKTI